MIKICQCCGVILKNALGSCDTCGVQLAFKAPSSMPSLSEAQAPEQIKAKEEPFLVEHVLANRIYAQAAESKGTGDQVVNKHEKISTSTKERSAAVSISISKPNQTHKPEKVASVDPHSFFDSMNNAIENVNSLESLKDEAETFHSSSEESVEIPKEEDNIQLQIPRKFLWLAVSTLAIGIIFSAYFISTQSPDKPLPEKTTKEETAPLVIEEKNKSVLLHRGDLLKKNKTAMVPAASKNFLNGDWKISYRSHNVEDTITFNQTDSSFSGHGKAFYANHVIHNFDISEGVLLGNGKIKFTKRYRLEARRNGAPNGSIYFEGVVSDSRNKITGKFKMETTAGHFNNRKTAFKEGPFTANLIRSYNPVVNNGFPSKIKFEDIPQDKIYFLIALGIVGFCVTLVIVSIKLFSPSGLLNRWEKEKYVPSQYKSQHKEKLKQFSKRPTAGSLPLGRRAEWHWFWPFTPKNLALPVEERNLNPNVLLLGSSKKGKTRLMASMVLQDIASNDRAVVIIDPDGSLSDLTIQTLASAPKLAPHTDRVIIIDPTEESSDIHSFNPLEYPQDGNLQSAANAIVHGFKAMYTEPPGVQSQWNEQTANILRNAALLLMLNGRTLIDLPNLLQDNDFRDLMLEKIEQQKDQKSEYIVIAEAWQQYRKLARTEQWINWVEPILNRIGPTLGDARVRRIIHKPVSSLNLKEIIAEKKILILRTPKGELDKSCNLLGSLLVTSIQKAALSLYKKEPSKQNPVSIYLEELDSFIEKDTMEKITNQAQRYQIGCIGSLKTLQHLPEDFKSCLTVNMGTIAAFSLPQKDAEILGRQIFRVDGRKSKFKTLTNFLNPINTSPQFELIMDEEKLNMDRLAGQADRTYFYYRIGTEAGVFKLHAPTFDDIPREKLDHTLLSKMWSSQD